MTALLDSSIRAVFIALAVAAIIGAARISHPRTRHRLWCGVLAAMLLLPLFSLCVPRTPLRVLPPIAATSPADFPLPEFSGTPAPLSAKPITDAPRPATPPDFLLGIYLCGVVLFQLRLMLGTVQAVSIRNRATSDFGFLVNFECACPITVGLARPVVILPESWKSWPQPELEAVLAHEREHARRLDPLVQWFAALNRCLFWFHPLAWWLERHLTHLAEEACDAAAISAGHASRDYVEYLLNQARAVSHAGRRVSILGAAMVRGPLARRIRRLLEHSPVPEPSRRKTVSAVALCAASIAAFTACRLDHLEKPAPGQLSMNEQMHRMAERNRKQSEPDQALTARARALNPVEAQQLLADFKKNPTRDTYWVLVRHHEYRRDLAGLDGLRLWCIEHIPSGEIYPGNIDQRYDPAGYQKGKKLWLANLKRPHPTFEIYTRAADFFEGADKPLAEATLNAGKTAHPESRGWPVEFGRHYAQVLLGSAGPLTAENVIPAINANPSENEHARRVRAVLEQSTDAPMLCYTAQWLVRWGSHSGRRGQTEGMDGVALAKTILDRAATVDPGYMPAKRLKATVANLERIQRSLQLEKISPAEQASLGDHDRMLLILGGIRRDWIQQKLDASESEAREVLKLAARNQRDPLYADALYEANIVLGKVALRRNDRSQAVRYLLASTDGPLPGSISAPGFEMNLPRALVDRGERRAVVDFLNRLAAKMENPARFREWANDISKGINPALPATSIYTCKNDPC